jgi:hypothetical protein
MYAWKCHKQTPCVGILNKPKHYFFFFYKNQRTGGWNRSYLGWGLEPQGGGGDRERIWEGECSANAVYTCI